jgi:hypothetical protein
MFRLIAAPLLAFSFLAPFQYIGHLFKGPARMEDVVSSSLYRITGSEEVNTWMGPRRINYSCTGFQVAPDRVMTAAHCVGDDMKADGLPVKVVGASKYFDLALLQGSKAPLMMRPSLEFRERPVERFEMLKSLGYGYGWDRLTILDNKVMLVNYRVVDEVATGIIVQGGYIGGMSGGPLVDLTGKVVGVVQMSNNQIGFSVGTTVIRAFLLDSEGGDADFKFTLTNPLNLQPIPFVHE